MTNMFYLVPMREYVNTVAAPRTIAGILSDVIEDYEAGCLIRGEDEKYVCYLRELIKVFLDMEV